MRTYSHCEIHGPQAVWQMLDNHLCKMRYDLGSDHAPWSLARFSGVNFNGIDLYEDEGIGGRKVIRSRRDIEQNRSDTFLLAMPQGARATLNQNGRANSCTSGSAILLSTQLPFSSSITAEQSGSHYVQLVGRISGSMLRHRLPYIDRLSNLVFSTESGAGRVVKSLFQLGIVEGDHFTAEQSQHYGTLVVDAVANAIRGVADAERFAPKLTSRDEIRRSAWTYIESNLSNPELKVGSVAKRCGVSQRYLLKAFEEKGIRLGVYIRESRLHHCREALGSPNMRHLSITDIALQSGYDDPAHFSRAYKNAFGTTPREDRQKRLGII